MNPITIPNITIPVIGLPAIGIPSVGFPSASGGGLAWPKGLKESIKAIYDPAKQGMTNYDVIEAYVEDFTTWGKYTNGVSVTNNTITISANINIVGNWITWKESYIDNMVVYVSGLSTAGNYVRYKYNQLDTTNSYISLKDGINIIPINEQHRGGFYTSALTPFTNDVIIKQLPTSILKDLSGNGNHAYLYGGKGKLNSGMGVYKFDFLSDLRIDSAYLLYTERQDDKICSLAGHPAGWLFQFTSLSDIPAFKVEVKGIVNDKFTYRWYDEKGNRGVDIAINEDGIYELPMSYSVETNTGVGIVCNDLCQDNVCFTQLPDYPNQLCYDGKMYAVCYGFPILEDYTVMADRTWFDKTGVRCFCSKYKDNTAAALFKFEWVAGNKEYTSSLGKDTNVVFVDSNITWQTKTSYNGKALTNLQYEDGEHLIIGNRYEGDYSTYVGCHGKIIIADRSFTEDEITWLKDNWKKI